MAEISSSYEPSYDYSNIGSVGGEAAQSVNGEMINKIRAGEEKSVLYPIIEDIDNITLETEKIEEIKTKIDDFQSIMNYFDLYNDENVFNQHHFDTTGSGAVFDAVDQGALENGTTTVNITQLAQRDVYQSETFGNKDASAPAGSLTIKVGTETIFDEADVSTMTYTELAQAINGKDGLTASVEQVGDSSYRLVVKSTETGTENQLTISGTSALGFDTLNQQVNSSVIDPSAKPANGEKITINQIDGTPLDFTFDGTTSYSDMITTINNHADFNATINSDNQIEITMSNDSQVTISTDVAGLSFSGENLNHTLKAQNLNADIDGVEYNTSSNSITTQGALKITAIEIGTSSVTVSKDTSAITVGLEAIATQYNELVEMLNEEIYDSDSVIGNKDTLRTILSDLKNMLFQNYGAEDPKFDSSVKDEFDDVIKEHSNVVNNDLNLFMFGFELDKTGKLTVDKDVVEEIMNKAESEYTTGAGDDGILGTDDDIREFTEDGLGFDALKSMFSGSFENKGLGMQMSEYLDDLDAYEGKLYNYDLEIIERKDDLEQDKEDEIERLDAKYGIMSEQFSAYSSLIAQMEASFSGLKMMIQQSTKSS